ncbi:tyrosine-protein kinase receptor Tie-2-like [Penaeus japonicus]|uniref:tyrosine-protein kinase receptor Tie-2-like n=1 Tax=Penaeus japonicus TaxID=27405 RepID=UPI001C70D71D|nr:tyrosine-protein kinase receptor Tie-2-like [Penaeus japonicus]
MAGGRSQSTAFLVMVAVASVICLSNVAADSSSVPDVNLVYDMTQFPGNTEALCVTGDMTLDLTATIIPDRYNEPKVVKESPNKIKFTRDLEARHLGQALMCTANNKGILVPLMTSDAKFIPRRLTVTVSQEQDLRLDLKTKSTQEFFWWMREPVKKTGPWTSARVVDDKLRIEHSLLQGSGLYSIAYKQEPIVYKELGFLAVTIRECREHQYGRACEEWCPDCMYGGECDAVTGECVCPPGLKGHRCQIKCNENKIGKSCNIDIDGNGKQICLVAPYGCECAPGYNGTKCETACSDGYWGAGCHQTCSHCVEGCTAIAGLCKKDKNADCVGGDLGLPRLRKPPRVTEIKHDRVTVTFDPWKAGYDDGELPSGSSLNYVVAYWVR